MPVREWKFRLEHMLEAIGRIQSYVEGMTYENFTQDSRTIDAVVRNFAILGEAVRHIPQHIQEKHPDVPWSAMAAMRNILIHDYERIDPEIIWRTILDDLPLLPGPLKAIKNEK